MAWRAFTLFVIFTFMYWFVLPLWFNYFDLTSIWLDTITDSYSWFAFFMMSIILGYMGTSALPMTKFGKGEPSSPSAPKYNNSHREDSEDGS